MLVLSRGTQGMFIPHPEKWEHRLTAWVGWLHWATKYKALCTGLQAVKLVMLRSIRWSWAPAPPVSEDQSEDTGRTALCRYSQMLSAPLLSPRR